jgi:hypothetical protein
MRPLVAGVWPSEWDYEYVTRHKALRRVIAACRAGMWTNLRIDRGRERQIEQASHRCIVLPILSLFQTFLQFLHRRSDQSLRGYRKGTFGAASTIADLASFLFHSQVRG